MAVSIISIIYIMYNIIDRARAPLGEQAGTP